MITGGQFGLGVERSLKNLHSLRIEAGYNFLYQWDSHHFNSIYLVAGYSLFKTKKKKKGYWDVD